MKVCSKCKIRKEFSEFGKRINHGKLTWQSACRDCRNLDARIYRLNNLELVKARNREWGRKNNDKKYKLNLYHRLKNVYNMTLEEYEDMVLSQGCICAICGRPDEKRKLTIDHDHETGRVRGLLCNPCNRGLGFMRDDLQTLRSAVEYLEYHERLGSTERRETIFPNDIVNPTPYLVKD